MKAQRPPGFLNVDLEIESSSPLSPLEHELSNSTITLYSGPGPKKRHLLCLECALWPENPDQAISLLCEAIEGLSTRGHKSWERAKKKQFDIGFEMIPKNPMARTILNPESVARIVALNATIAFTCYQSPGNYSPEPKKAAKKAKPGTQTKPKRARAKATPKEWWRSHAIRNMRANASTMNTKAIGLLSDPSTLPKSDSAL